MHQTLNRITGELFTHHEQGTVHIQQADEMRAGIQELFTRDGTTHPFELEYFGQFLVDVAEALSND